MRKKVSDPDPKAYLSTSEGKWRVIVQGSPLCADTDEKTARSVAAKYKIDLSHGRVWDGDLLAWRQEA